MNPGRLQEIKDFFRAGRAQGVPTPKTVTELIDAVEELLGCFAIEQHAEALRVEAERDRLAAEVQQLTLEVRDTREAFIVETRRLNDAQAELAQLKHRLGLAQELADEWGSDGFVEDCGNWYATQLHDVLKDKA